MRRCARSQECSKTVSSSVAEVFVHNSPYPLEEDRLEEEGETERKM